MILQILYKIINHNKMIGAVNIKQCLCLSFDKNTYIQIIRIAYSIGIQSFFCLPRKIQMHSLMHMLF